MTLGGNPIPVHTYTGTTTINGGTVMQSGNNIPSGNIILNGGVLESYWSDTFIRALGSGTNQIQIPGGVSGFSLNGNTSQTVLLNNNAATEAVWGSTNFNPSTFVLQSPTSQSASAVTFGNNVDLNGSTRTVQVSGGTTGAAVAIMSGVVRNSTGTAGLIKTGTGRLVLSGANTYNGDTTVSNGILQVANNNAGNIGSGNYAGNISIASGATLRFWNSGSQTVSGVISGSGNLEKAYAGALTLSGNNTYTGKTFINTPTAVSNGSLVVSSLNSVNGGTPLMASSSLGAPTTVASGTISIGNAASQSSNILKYIGPGETTDRVINAVFNGNSGPILDSSGSGLLKFTSGMTFVGGTNGSGVTFTGTGNGEFAGNISLPLAAHTITKSGNGTWTISGGLTSTNGKVTVNGGTLYLTGTNSYTGQTAWESTGGTLVVNSLKDFGVNSSIGQGTAGVDILTTRYAPQTLTYTGSGDSTNRTFQFTSYNIADTPDFTIKNNGTGPLTFSANTLNTYSNNAANRNFTFHVGGTYAGGTNKIQGVIQNATTATTGKVFLVKDNDASTWVLTGVNTYTGATTISGGTLQIGDGVTDGSIAASSNVVNNANLTYNLVGSRSYGNVISGSGQLNKLGAGTLNLTGTNTYTGTTTISEGTLSVGNGVTDGSIASSSKIIDNANLIYNLVGSRTYANVISGTGTVSKLGGGTLTLSGANSYTGTTTVSAGTLAFTTAVASSTNWDVSITSSATSGLMTLPAAPNLTGKVINISSTATDNNFSKNLITWTGTAVGTPTFKINGVTVTSGVFLGNDKVTFNANAITFTRGNVLSFPTSLTATYGNTQVSLSWTAPGVGDTPVSDYVIEYKPTATSTWSIFADGVSTSTTGLVTGLTNGVSYDFRVSAVNAAGQGTASSVTSATPATFPSAPVSVIATRGNNQATVSFTLPSDGGSAILYYTIISDPGNISTTTSTTTGVVTGLTNGTAYTFTVTATNAVGTGSSSVPSNSVTPATVPDAPTAFSATVGNAQISLFWSAPSYDGASAITDYAVDYKLTSTSIWATFAEGVSVATTSIVTGLLNGSSYDFRVSAINDVGQGSASGIISATPITVPDAPTIGIATRGNTEASVTFTPPVFDGGSTILSYTVTSDPGSFINTGTSSPIIVTGLTNGTPYTFTVTATNAAGTGSSSASSNIVIPATVPDAPISVIAIAGQGLVNLSWDAPGSDGGDAIIDYAIEYKLSASSTWSGFADGVSALTSGTVTGLQNGLFYDFRVSAINTVGQGSPSLDVSAKPITVPDAPTTVSAVPGDASATVTFSAPVFDGGTSINSYTVTSNPGNISASGAASPIIVTGLTNGTSYTFTVTATNAVGTGASSTASVAVIPVTIPGAPMNVTAAEGNTQATISFDPPVTDGGTPILNYKVTSNPGGFTAIASSSPIIVAGLTNGTTYTFTVTATNAVGEGPVSAVSNSVTLSTEPNAPVNLAATVLGSSIGLTWSAPALDGGKPITDYIVEYQLTTGGVWSVFADGVSVNTTAIITGLSNDTSYDFRVRAVNIIGQSIPSSIVVATPGEPAQVIIQSFSDLTNPSIGTNVRITNEGSIQYEYQYSWCVTDSALNVCGGGDDIFAAGAAKLVQPLENWDFVANSTVLTPGNYWFHVNVTYGSKTSTAYQSFIAVATYPDAPTSVSAVSGNAQATVSFIAPVSNGGAVITSYKVTSVPGGITATGATSPIIISGLTNGTSYTFTVTATNAVGEGAASAPSVSVTPATIPDAPTGLMASAGNTQVGLAWTAPVNTGGLAITDYIIEFKLNSASIWQVFADGISVGTNVIVTGLTNNSSYDFRVSAVNALGQSSVNSTNANPASPAAGSSGTSGSYIIYPPQVPVIVPTSTTTNAPVIVPVDKIPSVTKTPTTPIKTEKPITPVKPGSKPITPTVTITPTATSVISEEVIPHTRFIGSSWLYIIILIILLFFGSSFFIIFRRRKKELGDEKDDDNDYVNGNRIHTQIEPSVKIKRDDYFEKITPKIKKRVDSL